MDGRRLSTGIVYLPSVLTRPDKKNNFATRSVAFFTSVHLFLEQSNSEKDLLQKSSDALSEEHKGETEKLKEELKQKLQTAAEQYEVKLQAEINKGKYITKYSPFT